MIFLKRILRVAQKVEVVQLEPPNIYVPETVLDRQVIGSIADDEPLKQLWGLHLKMLMRWQGFMFKMQQKYPGQPLPQALPGDDMLHGNQLQNHVNFSLSCFWGAIIDRWPQGFGHQLTLCREWEIVATSLSAGVPPFTAG